jgi:hypothetical protein
MHIWGCHITVPAHELKKSDNRATDGKFGGFAKNRSLFRWLDPTTNHFKHAHGAHFMEIDPLHPPPPLDKQLLALDRNSYPEITIDLGDRAHFNTEPLLVAAQLPPIGMPLDIEMAFDDA